jgi:hypothetical protein
MQTADRLLRDLKDAFAKAESMETHSSLVNDKLNINLNNQLRYAGFHLLSAYQSDGEWNVEELRGAISHCKRAHCDALDSVATSLIKSCNIFTEKYIGNVEVTAFIPNYNELLVQIEEAQTHLRNFLIRKHHGERDDEIDHFNLELRERQIQDLTPYIEKLTHIRTTFLVADSHIAARIEKNKNNKIGEKRLIWIVAIVGPIVAGIITWFLLFFLKK